MTRLLLQERPIVLLPSLAKELGSADAAAFLQQLHYWSKYGRTADGEPLGKLADGRRWIRNTLVEWVRYDLQWLTTSKLGRIIKKLEQGGYITIRSDLNEHGYDRTHWYAINYGKFGEKAPTIDQSDVQPSFFGEEELPPKQTKKKKPDDPTNAMNKAVRLVCKIDPKAVPYTQYLKLAERLVEAEYTPEEVKKWYGEGGWWYQEDWRGQKGYTPSPQQITETIFMAKNHEGETRRFSIQ